ncbi:MAG: TolC family outer membrane protein [Burkholderiales bacterium]|nr:TolC family outer membrane protein [Burkholderiales bacterium]
MNAFRLLPLSMALGAALALPAQAQSLVALYESARAYDASYQSVKSLYDSTLAKSEQARAGLLHTIGLSANASLSTIDNTLARSKQGFYDTQSATLSASKPLYRPANQITFNQSQRQIEVVEQQLLAAEQDLIVKVSTAYFDVLAAQDSLTFVLAQKAAVSDQLASAKRNFEVGTATITDTREAQARFDLVIAQEIAGRNDLQVKKLALDQLVGKANTAPLAVRLPLTLPPVLPDDVAPWVQKSEEQHPGIQQSRLALDVAQMETRKAQAASKPTLDLNGNLNLTQNGESTSSTSSYRTTTASVGLSFTMPLFSGYAIENRLKETLSLEDKARTDLDAIKRTVAQGSRAAFYGLLSGQGQVKALEAAEASSQSALDANKLGYQVGVRINIDVLNSQSQLFDTKAKLAKARYDVLVGGLKLRQATGVLKADDLKSINALLAN